MNDFDRMKAILRRSARDETVPPGRVEYATAAAGVARILEQVDTAVLGQRLSFEFDDSTRLVCAASGRRLVRLLAPTPRGLTAREVALFDREELAASDGPVLSNILLGLCERGAGVLITVDSCGDDLDLAQGGVAPAAIAEAAGLPGAAMFEMHQSASHAAFIDMLGPSLEAAILLEGEEASQVLGDGDGAAFIADWVDSSLEILLSPGFPLLGTLETNGILVFALPESAGRHLLIAGRRGSLLVATVRGGDIAGTLDLWRGKRQTSRKT